MHAQEYSSPCDSVFLGDLPAKQVASGKQLDMSSGDHTSTSLLYRALAREPDAWQRLVTLYAPLVRHWCRQAGVPDDDVEDVSQDVFASVSSSLPNFRADWPGTTFRAWMRGIARHKLLHYLQDRDLPGAGGTDALKFLHQVPDPMSDLELSESPAEVGGVYQRALSLVRNEFEDRTWQAFWRVVVEDHATGTVAAEMGISPNAVRQAKSRVLRRLKEEMGELIS